MEFPPVDSYTEPGDKIPHPPPLIGGGVLVNGFGGHVGGLHETEERWAYSARYYRGNTGLKCNLEMRLMAVKEAAEQILHVDGFGSSNRV